jgi:hypothetical protein
LPGVDVILNLDCAHKEDLDVVLDVLKKRRPPKGMSSFFEISFNPEHDNKKFFIKRKYKSVAQRNVDFVLNRSNDDPINPTFLYDFDNKARYALSSILNEITLSPRIKRLVASSAFQQLAKKYGFVGMEFSEPIAGVIEKYIKYLIYRNVKDTEAPNSLAEESKIDSLTCDLRKLFTINGIIPHDLKPEHLLTTKQDGKPFIHLTDIEAYTKV